MGTIEELSPLLQTIRYPKGIVACPENYGAIPGQSFFPGGNGHVTASMPLSGTMYLGHNFDKLEGFLRSRTRGWEENLTWRRIRDSVLPYLAESGVWFTNYFMGALQRESNTGPLEHNLDFFPFEEDCWDFFKVQLLKQRPRVVVALGKEVVQALSPMNRLNIPEWNLGSRAFNPLRLSTRSRCIHHDESPVRFKVVAAYHPSYGRSTQQIAEIVRDSKFVASLVEG